jgi:CRISPR/Cas system CSM-associated protein Csm3 (group 7 of RAMP superfamily)
MKKLVASIILKGKIKTVTYMYIKNNHIEDLPVITSHMLKNRMVDLLSMNYGIERENLWAGHRCKDSSCFLCLIFGTDNERRLTIRDSLPVKKEKYFPWEFKSEGNNLIRQIPVNTEFSMEMLYKIFDFNKDRGKRDSENFKYIIEAFTLIEENYIGKGGGRGMGKVHFSDLSIKIFLREENNIELSLPCEWIWQEDIERGIKKLVRNESL